MQSPHQVWQPWFQVVWGWRPVCVFHWIWPTWSNCLDLASSHPSQSWEIYRYISNSHSVLKYIISQDQLDLDSAFIHRTRKKYLMGFQKSTTKDHNKSPQQKYLKIIHFLQLFEQTSSLAVSILWPISSDKR